MSENSRERPLVYSCSGASSAAQLANYLAVQLDRADVAEMSCIAGVGGDVQPLVRLACSGRPIVAIDGCALHCVKHVLARHGIAAKLHLDLSTEGVKKRKHVDFDAEQALSLLTVLRQRVETCMCTLPVGSTSNSGKPPREP